MEKMREISVGKTFTADLFGLGRSRCMVLSLYQGTNQMNWLEGKPLLNNGDISFSILQLETNSAGELYSDSLPGSMTPDLFKKVRGRWSRRLTREQFTQLCQNYVFGNMGRYIPHYGQSRRIPWQ